VLPEAAALKLYPLLIPAVNVESIRQADVDVGTVEPVHDPPKFDKAAANPYRRVGGVVGSHCRVDNANRRHGMRDNIRNESNLAAGSKTLGFTAIGIFLFFGAAGASLVATTLYWQGTILDRVWATHPTAYKQLALLGRMVLRGFRETGKVLKLLQEPRKGLGTSPILLPGRMSGARQSLRNCRSGRD
jgi:hypothetical protein